MQVSFNGCSVSNGSGARRFVRVGFTDAGGSLTLRFYFLRSFPFSRARATPLFLDTRDTVVRRPRTSRERTPTLARTDGKNCFSPHRPSPRSPASFHEIRSAPFFLSRQTKRTLGRRDRRDGLPSFCPPCRGFTNLREFFSALRHICSLCADVELILYK